MSNAVLSTDFYELFYKYFEKTVLAISDKSISPLTRQMAAYFLIEDAFFKLANEEQLAEWFQFDPNKASSIHYFVDLLDEFYVYYENEVEDLKISDPGIRRMDDWESEIKASLYQLQSEKYLKIVKSYNWSDYDIELTRKLKQYQKVPYSVVIK